MKKILLSLIVICACVFSLFAFTACSTTNLQGNSWEDKEIFDYTATKDGENIGTLTIKSTRISRNAEPIRIEAMNKSFSISGGTKIETTYSGNDGKTMYSIGLLDASNKTPVASYRVEKDSSGNILKESKATYRADGNKYVCNYSYKDENGITQSKEFKQSALFCDNATIYYLLRTYSHDALSQALSVPSFPNGKVISLKAVSAGKLNSTGASVNVSEKKTADEPVLSVKDAFELTRVGISLNSTPSGEPNYVDYTVENEAQSFGRESNASTKIPFKIKEGEVIYILNAITVSA